MRRFPNEIAVQAMFVKVCERYNRITKDGEPYVEMTSQEIDELMAEILEPKPKAAEVEIEF